MYKQCCNDAHPVGKQMEHQYDVLNTNKQELIVDHVETGIKAIGTPLYSAKFLLPFQRANSEIKHHEVHWGNIQE